MKPLKEHVGMTIDADINAKVHEYAEKDGQSFSRYINIVLKRHVAEVESKLASGDRVGFDD